VTEEIRSVFLKDAPSGEAPRPPRASAATLPLVFALNIVFVTATFIQGSALPGAARGALCWKILVPVSRVSTPTRPAAAHAQCGGLLRNGGEQPTSIGSALR